ncbi:hypothetical protein Tco_0997597 [Tanacetum coccineum]
MKDEVRLNNGSPLREKREASVAYAPNESKSQWQSDANTGAQDASGESPKEPKWPILPHTARAQDVSDESKSQWPSDAHYPERKTLRMSPRANGQVTHITRSAIRSG